MYQTYEDPLRNGERPRPDEDTTTQIFEELAVHGQGSIVVETVSETQSQQDITELGDEAQIQTPLPADGEHEVVSTGIQPCYC